MSFLDKSPPDLKGVSEKEGLLKLRNYIDLFRKELNFQLSNLSEDNFNTQYNPTCFIGTFELTSQGSKVIEMSWNPSLVVCLGSNESITFGWTKSPAYNDKISVTYVHGTSGDKYVTVFKNMAAGKYCYIAFR